MLKSFRYLLLPFSLLYGIIIWLRNKLFDINFFKSASFNFPVICVGNLAVGGTGKTPLTEYLIETFQNKYKIATVSRGYKRMTKGFAIANEYSTAIEIGDEPMQFHQKFPGITVSVGEERLEAIPQLLHQIPDTQVIILDDAFQHRSVKAGLNIVLTEYKNLYTRDLMMPAGDLRDVKSSMKRADLIIVSKCTPDLSAEESAAIQQEINPINAQKIFFTKIVYSSPYHLFYKNKIELNEQSQLLLICGIANPAPLKQYLTQKVNSYDMILYRDHHIFKMDDLEEILNSFNKMSASNKIILTTEKDAVRLQKFKKELLDFPIYVLPIQHEFLFNKKDEFNTEVERFIQSVCI